MSPDDSRTRSTNPRGVPTNGARSNHMRRAHSHTGTHHETAPSRRRHHNRAHRRHFVHRRNTLRSSTLNTIRRPPNGGKRSRPRNTPHLKPKWVTPTHRGKDDPTRQTGPSGQHQMPSTRAFEAPPHRTPDPVDHPTARREHTLRRQQSTATHSKCCPH